MLTFAYWVTWCVCGICVFYVIIAAYNQITYWKRRNVPYEFDLPFISGIPSLLFKRTTFPEVCLAMYNRFPTARYYGTRSINKPLIVIRDIELIREICIKHFECFTDHNTVIDSSADPIFGRSIFALKGQRWREMRGTLSPSFTANKMKFMFQLVSQCANDFVTFYKKHPETLASGDMKDAFTRYTNDVIATAAFGISVNSLEHQDNEFYLHGKRVIGFGNVLIILKMLSTIIAPKLMRLLGVTILPGNTIAFFRNLISRTLKLRDEKGIVRPDMIHLLMQARDQEKIEMTIDDIVAQSVIFFLAGFDPTSTLLGYIAQELAHNQEVQDKLRKEVDDCFPSSDVLTYECLSKMKYMDMVISETLRKYPSAPAIDRVCTKTFKFPPGLPAYSEYTVEVGTVISIPVYAIHHDKSYYPSPEKFDPERFSDQNKDSIDPCVYMPFGLGPRKCIANRFALMEIKILVAYLVQNFLIKPNEKTKYPIIFNTNFTMTPKEGFWNSMEHRKKYN